MTSHSVTAKWRHVVGVWIVALAVLAGPALAGSDAAARLKSWLDLGASLAATDESDASVDEPAVKGPPLPLHCIEGYGGGAITPIAYVVNPGAKGNILSVPTTAYTFINMGSKKLQVFSVTQVFFNRLEFGYALNHLEVGSLYDDLRKAGLNMGRDHVNLHHFNLRLNFLDENAFDLPLPAMTAGIHFKYNDSINRIDKSLGGAFSGIGYEHPYGIDYTMTATKMLPKLAFGRPVILTGGLRLSNASQLGYFGFGNEHNLTFEGSILYMPIDQVLVGYEFRQKRNPYHRIRKLVDEEDNWHMFSLSWIVNDRLTISGLWGVFGQIANTKADCSLGLQIKYEF
ncbi:hypothetical protein LCGC14_0124820 [marine sediment metagenome]|uniref:DUF3034 domain-containing protein n=1 Tax=marine sediment metagenome TaxID=412755 RepID=A0A0F9VLE4_9ZZZZ|nr:DUF3034 family protein [Phycisphaerae bacterium]HDZ43657.1 DUF3034 family protein [Phycisphaerae bacterium]